MESAPLPVLAPSAPWVVIKFGGTSVSARERWHTIAAIAARHRAAGRRVLIVVSALSGVTDQLKAICAQRTDPQACRELRDALVERHSAMVAGMDLDDPGLLAPWFERLDELLAEPRHDTSRYPWQAEVLAIGELLSSTLGAAFLDAQALPTGWLDARAHLCAEALPNQGGWAGYLSAWTPTRSDPAFAAGLAARGDVFITQGFIARNPDGETVVLGRGGSDTSAACFGAMLKAECVEIWTDVPGMFSANPRQVPDARLLKRLDYEEAQEIASTGAKVLHPRALNPVREARVPLVIRDTHRPETGGTAIGAIRGDDAVSIKAISARMGITLVSMESVGMWQQVGFLADVFDEFKRHGLSVDLIGSAETNVTVSLDPNQNLVDSDVLAALAADLARVCRVKVIAPCASVTLVGRGMRAMLHTLSAVLAEFGALDVHLISQSSNNLNLTFVVDEAVVEGLLPRLHALLIRAGAMRVEDGALFGPRWCELAQPPRPIRAPWWRGARGKLLEIAATATPCHVYDLATVRDCARALVTASVRAGTAVVDRWHYALKANPHADILRTLHAEGFAFECVSIDEVAAVRAALPEIDPATILYTPNFASRAEFRAALADGVRVTLDALHPLAEWGADFAGRAIFLRVDLGVGRGHHDKVRTAGAASKFGVALDEIGTFRELAHRHGVRIVGLHAHAGSGVLDADHWRDTAAQLASLAQSFEDVEVLDIGGGLGVPEHADEAPLDPDQLAAGLAEVRRAYPQFALWMEPGRYLVAESGVLLARVTQTKRKGTVRYVGVDAGMNSLLRPALYDAWHEIVNLDRLDEGDAELVQVVGPICETGDVIGRNRRLPACREGDVLLIANTGAYGAVMSSRYNLREPAAEVVFDSSGLRGPRAEDIA